MTRNKGPRPHLGTHLTADTAHQCPPGRHVCCVCGEAISFTRKGVTPRWVHRRALGHNALHHVGTCRYNAA